MILELCNSELSAKIGTRGAELLSLRPVSNQETELMWRGDEGVWARTAPSIFPMLGGFPEDRYEHGGKSYSMEKNGFARDMEFCVEDQTDNSVTLSLRSDAETREKYPFDFKLSETFSVNQNKLCVIIEAENRSERVMPAAVGLHPGFAWARNGARAEIEFSEAETLDAFRPDGSTVRLMDGENCIVLTPELVRRGALSMHAPRSAYVTLCQQGKDYAVRVYRAELEYLTFWSPDKENADFICIEPSTSVGTKGNHLTDRNSITLIAPGETLRKKLEIEIIKHN